ncbi:MAG: hypothetical protein JXQ29_01260 [Planctomycetes bacterium]|nr:hypothetical protein [Planctomycetota bacterium]
MRSRRLHCPLVLPALLLVALLHLSSIGCPLDAQDLNVPLRVVETFHLARQAETVTSGVPLPIELGIHRTDGLGVFDPAEREIPAQFKVLSRWHGRADDSTRPIKWLLVSFQTDMDASGERLFALRRGRGIAPAAPVQVTDGSAGVRVDTGPLVFTVSRHSFNLLDTLQLDGRQLIRSLPSNGFVLRDYRGRTYRSSARAPESIVVEEAGPIRAVVRVEGLHSDGEETFLRYIVRIHAYAGQPYVRVFYALRNDSSYGYATPAAHAYLRDGYLDLTCDLGTPPRASFRDESYVLDRGQYRVLEQDMVGADNTSKVADGNLNLLDNFVRRVRDENGRVLTELGGQDGLKEIGRDPGFLDLGTDGAGLMVGVRHFWENFPKVLVGTADGTVRVGMWPEFGEYVDPGYYARTPPPAGAEHDYTFGGGRQKTHEILLFFRTQSAAAVRVREQVMAFHNPLFATAPPAWFAESQAIQLMVDARDWSREPGIAATTGGDLNRFERFQAAKWSPVAVDAIPYLGHVTYKAFRDRGGPYGGRQFFGWMNFGDTPWGDGFSQGHYDWPYSTLLSFVRTEERELLELGVVMARHRMDIDQYHTTLDRFNISGGQRFEKGERHGDMTVPPTPSHTWIHGLLLYWALTGDEFAREAAAETLAFYRGYWNRVGPPFYGLGAEARTGGWSLMGLVELYDYLGEAEALELAQKIVSAFVNREQDENTSGYYLAGADTIMPWMFGIYLNGLGKYYFHTGQRDGEARGLLDRMAAWFTGDPNGFGPLVGGTGTECAYHPYALWYRWHPDPGKRGDTPRINLLHVIDGLAYAYMATGRDAYLDTALAAASDLWRYWTTTRALVDRTDPGHLEPITIRPSMFPNSESKILGWITRYGHAVHYATHMREAMPPVLVEVRPRGAVAGSFPLRIRVTRNRPVFDLAGARTYDGGVRADGVPSTWVVVSCFRRTASPFTETWYAPLFLLPNETLHLDATVWAAPDMHRVVAEIRGEGE